MEKKGFRVGKKNKKEERNGKEVQSCELNAGFSTGPAGQLLQQPNITVYELAQRCPKKKKILHFY